MKIESLNLSQTKWLLKKVTVIGIVLYGGFIISPMVMFLIVNKPDDFSSIQSYQSVDADVSTQFYSNPNTFQSDSNISEIEFEYNFNYTNLSSHLNILNPKFPFFDMPFISSVYHKRHIFRSISDHFYNFDTNLTVKNIYCGDIIFVKTDLIREFFERVHNRIGDPYILLTHESAYHIGHIWQLKYLNDPKLIRWYGQNPQIEYVVFLCLLCLKLDIVKLFI